MIASPSDPLEEIALLVRTLPYGTHVRLAAGLLSVAGIKPDFGTQQQMAKALHQWALEPPADPPLAFPSAAPPPAPARQGAALFPAAGDHAGTKRRPRRKQPKSDKPAHGHVQPPAPITQGVAVSPRADASGPSDARGVSVAAALHPHSPSE